MSTFVTVSKARKAYTCANFGTFAHYATILPGETYARISQPPPYLAPKGAPWEYHILCAYCWDNRDIPYRTEAAPNRVASLIPGEK